MEVYTKQEIDALLNVYNCALPTFVNLMGPRQGDGYVIHPVGTEWKFLTALTASTKMFQFQMGMPPCAYARWMVVWTPNNVAMAARLLAFDYAVNAIPLNPTELGVVQSDGSMNPRPMALEFTDGMNKLIAGRQPKHIGFMVRDDGVNNWILYESRLELTFTLPRGIISAPPTLAAQLSAFTGSLTGTL